MNVCEIMRRVSVGGITIRLWIRTSENLPCGECEERADEIALCASTLADDDDNTTDLAYRLARTLTGLGAIEVVDTDGNGVVLHL